MNLSTRRACAAATSAALACALLALPPAPALVPGQGGPFVPVFMAGEQLQLEIDRLAREVALRSDELSSLESRFLESRARARQLPTALPVKDAILGSPFGHHSPVGAYDAAADRVLVLDTYRQGWDPWWAPVPVVLAAMSVPDPDAGAPRGWLEITASAG